MFSGNLSITLLFIFLSMPLLTSNATAQDKRPEELYKNTLPSVMTLIVEKRNGRESLGTAFLISKDGIAATAWHVVKNAKRVLAKFSSGEEFSVSGIEDFDEIRDIALIRVKVFGRPTLEFAKSDPPVGSRVYVVGAPQGLEFSISDGLLSQVRSIGGRKEFQFSCPASPGNSGGPLLNSDGEALGVVSWQITNGQNLNFAVPYSYIQGLDRSLPTKTWESLPESNNEIPLTIQAPSRPTFNSLADLAGTYTGKWESEAYVAFGEAVMIIQVNGQQVEATVTITGSQSNFRGGTLICNVSKLGEGVWKLDFKGKGSSLSGTGIFKDNSFIGDYRYRQLLWVDRGKWRLKR